MYDKVKNPSVNNIESQKMNKYDKCAKKASKCIKIPKFGKNMTLSFHIIS